MAIKLVISDMDGTLFGKNEDMPAFTGQFSTQLQQHGILFAVATGRSLPLARRFVDVLRPTAPCVYANGALICSEERTVTSRMLPLQPLRAILDTALEDGMSVMINWDRKEDFVLRRTQWLDKQYELFGVYGTQYYPSDEEWKTCSAYKVQVKDPKRNIQKICDLLCQIPQDCAYVQYEYGATEIMPVGLNKAKGILELGAALGIAPDEIAAIGDFYNDIEMMTAVGWGVAVSNAIDDVKKCAKYVCQRPGADGVREIVQRLCRNEGVLV